MRQRSASTHAHPNRGHALGQLILELRTIDTWPDVEINAWYLAQDVLVALNVPAELIDGLIGPPPARHTDTITALDPNVS